MVLSSKVRGILYVISVVAAVIVGGLVVVGVVTQDTVIETIMVVEAIALALQGLLARLNLNPES